MNPKTSFLLPVSCVGIKDPRLFATSHSDDNVGAVHGVNLVVSGSIAVGLYRMGVNFLLGIRFRPKCKKKKFQSSNHKKFILFVKAFILGKKI